MTFLRSLIVAAAACATAAGAAAACPGPAPASSPQTADGVAFKVLLNGLARPRGVVMDGEGNLLVVEAKGKGVTRVVLDDGAGLDVCVSSSAQLISDGTLNHGIALSGDGKTLFVSSGSDAYAYPYDAASGTVGEPRHVLGGMQQGGHVSRTLLVPRHNPELLLVSRGSDGNIDEETAEIGSGRSQLRAFTIADLVKDGAGAVEYTSGAVLGWGLRNSVGVADDPSNGHIWTVENSIDNMKRGSDDIHNSNPGEELNYHGAPNDTASAQYGRNYGYPGCVAIYDPSNVKDFSASSGGPKVGLQMTGDHIAGYTDDWCRDNATAPRLTFGSHLAPLDIKFLPDGSAALIAFHGSWNRQPPNGYRLSRVTFGADGQPVARADSADAEEKLLWNADNAECPGGCFRPVGLWTDEGKGAAGRVFMTSDSSGELFVVTGVGSKAKGTGGGGEDVTSGAERMRKQFGGFFW
ncbi:Soluble quinoprotein glucose/sorbosone dehydrogenase [Cordyceps fumosorosea ARSEF 2679]|uniref:Soluble quinoprotein glucose/sorbosone dehydrogenase n=1 Tax=Cordyceps fumosorosea (strain ARSEF 2679) TaxID=1081104 RepID=A0A162LJ28_CORFA|nr:Soluble quinoprotein glucose/sorbosone dehydrogenase [Cordyceps fumosorosea ARSEF 2679]OAA71224.1 Soluble quinoprotein glucose/sorbosone dehydrogenase [Cordyceps fumosorosea ARSEF 2679]